MSWQSSVQSVNVMWNLLRSLIDLLLQGKPISLPAVPLTDAVGTSTLNPTTELFLKRIKTDLIATVGSLELNNQFICYTLEPTVLEIPCGTYTITFYDSPKEGYRVPLLSVPGRDHIEMHIGNWAKDSLGCILVGLTDEVTDEIEHSKDAFNTLMSLIQNKENITITIS
jgi:hypothetical protein